MGTLRSDENEQQASARIRIGGSLLVRNALLNFIGQVIPLLVGIACIPFVVRGLGTERFGLLSLAWVILGYFSIFDLGLGRAATKFVAEALGKGEQEQLPHLVWTAVAVQSVMGIAGGLVLAAITPLLVEHFLHIPPELLGEARDTFHLLALAAPVLLVSASFAGVLEAAQRFDLVNAVRVPSSASTYLLPLLGVFLHLHLPGIVALMLAARLMSAAAFVLLDLQIMPSIKRISVQLALVSRLVSYGSWVAVTSAVSPILVYADRFMIGAALSMTAVAHYAVPYEAVTHLTIVPASLTMTLFPAFSTLEGLKNREALIALFGRSVKYVLLVMVPIAVVAWLFAEEALRVWLGASFASESTLVLQILALGVLLNSLALIPFALLQGIGRPDLPAKFHLIELPVYVGIAWVFISRWGIAGAAWAWTLRMALDCLLLFTAAIRVRRFVSRSWASKRAGAACLSLLVFSGMAYALKRLAGGLPLLVQVLLLIGLLILFVSHSWTRVLDVMERRAILDALKLKRKVDGTRARSV